MIEVDHAAIAAIVMMALIIVELAKVVVGKYSKKNGCGMLTATQQEKLNSIHKVLSAQDADSIPKCYAPRGWGKELKEQTKATLTQTAMLKDMKATLDRIEKKL